MISFLSLIAAALAVFFGPLVAWVIAERKNETLMRQAWSAEFRDNVAALLAAYDRFVLFLHDYSSESEQQQQALAMIQDSMRLPFHKIRLLIMAHDPRYGDFIPVVERMVGADRDRHAERRNAVVDAAACVLEQESTLIVKRSSVWAAIWNAARPTTC